MKSRLMHWLVLATIALTAGSSTAEAARECITKVGTKAKPFPAEQLFEMISAIASPKGEFETTAAFEARIEKVRRSLSKNYLVEGTYFPEQVRYDADREHFMMNFGAWDTGQGAFEQILGPDNRYRLGPIVDPIEAYGVGLSVHDSASGNYVAGNALGAKVEVKGVLRRTYALYDLSLAESDSLNVWDFEYPDGRMDRHSPDRGVYLPAKLEFAEGLKNSLKVSFEFNPKAPYVAEGSFRIEPTIRSPLDVSVSGHILVADIHCAVISGQDGVVIKTVQVGYGATSR